MFQTRLKVARAKVRGILRMANRDYVYGLSVRDDGCILKDGKPWSARANMKSKARVWTFNELVQRELDRTAMG